MQVFDQIHYTKHPTLWIMVGIAGSGKSTAANFLKDELEAWDPSQPASVMIISTDDIREELFGDAGIQRDAKQVFKIAFDKIHNSLQAGVDVIFDATNLGRGNRRCIIQEAGELAQEVNAVFVDTELSLCMHRQLYRERKVPNEVILRQAYKLQTPELSEGFEHIYWVINSTWIEVAHNDICQDRG